MVQILSSKFNKTSEEKGGIMEDRYERGLELLKAIDGENGISVIDSLRGIAPDVARYIVEFAFGDVYVEGS